MFLANFQMQMLITNKSPKIKTKISAELQSGITSFSQRPARQLVLLKDAVPLTSYRAGCARFPLPPGATALSRFARAQSPLALRFFLIRLPPTFPTQQLANPLSAGKSTCPACGAATAANLAPIEVAFTAQGGVLRRWPMGGGLVRGGAALRESVRGSAWLLLFRA